MNTQDNYPCAVKVSEQTIKFLSQYEVAPTPINFSVIYHYLSKSNELLNQYIDEYISWHGSLDAVFIESAFLEFFSTTDQLERSLLTPFEQTLSSTMEKLQTQVDNGNEIASNLQRADNVLAKSTRQASFKPVLKFINATLAHSQHQHQELNKELAETYQQVKQLKSQLKASRDEAMLDALTGLYNRRGCDEKLKELSKESTHASCLIDIDHFKNINDSFGHAVGDQVIQKVAATIKEHLSSTDFAVRQGGEEFIVVLANQTKKDAKSFAETIRIAITKLRLKQKKTNAYLPPISVSVGVAEYQESSTWKSVFEKADSALYQAKNAGRNCCIVM
ncbi:GGDEF domain-containing protein [Thalassotalea insulae]|uniref:diguanylate cyclase n=1 Tax=Thalassotalea insulae TaxID=2056778 RepID=A0ABQ6GRV7_9GAMM|nr:GGDEF domain-containing protein [Thalassotalea insulae]GLX77431.1 GGDEF domain-containing protein [Thalassotalea insulae]